MVIKTGKKTKTVCFSSMYIRDLNLAPIRFVQFVPRFFPRCPLYSFIISMVDPTSAMYASAIYVSYIYVHNIHAKQLTMKLPKKPTKKHAFFTHYNSNACADTDHVESIFCHDGNINSLLGVFFSRSLR